MITRMHFKSSEFSWGPIFVTAFGPSILFGIAQGAILPVIALSALQLQASYALSGVIAALIGIGVLLNNIPAALFTRHVGERWALVGASVFSICGLLLCVFARNLPMLTLGVFMQGMSMAVFNLARQAYILHIVPFALRARAFSIMGGSQRVGTFVGPFLGAAAMYMLELKGAYWVAVAAATATLILCYLIPDLPTEARQQAEIPAQQRPATGLRSLWPILVAQRRVFMTLGLGVMCLGALRASRPIALPLWAEHMGLSPTTIAFVFGLSAAVDMLFFYPAGVIMDKYGRGWIAVPSVLLMGLAYMLLPLTGQLISFIGIALFMGVGNGISAGIVMTLGADAAPKDNEIEFLGLWRVFTDAGQTAGPLLISLLTALLTLGTGIATIGLSGLLAAWLFGRTLLTKKPETP